MSYLSMFGFSKTQLKVPFTAQQLELAKNKLKTANLEDQKYHPLDNPSWKYIRRWVKENPRFYDQLKLIKFRDVILDKDFPPIRQRFTFDDESEDDEVDLWNTATKISAFFGAYLVFLAALSN